MKIRASTRGMVCAVGAIGLAAGSVLAGPVTFRRVNDWVPGTIQGSVTGNPAPGPVGNLPTWQYEWVTGGPLTSANPWYLNAGTLMTWDGAWWQTGWGVWSKGDDINPPILAGRLIHNVHASVYADVPLVRWLNPLGDGWTVDIVGTLLINWNGVNGLGRPNDVDVVIAKYDASSNTTSLLFSATVSKPNPFPSVGDSVLLPVNISGIPVDTGDQLIFTHRGHTPLAPLGAWINMFDGLTLTAVPTPATGVLVGLGLLTAMRRRR